MASGKSIVQKCLNDLANIIYQEEYYNLIKEEKKLLKEIVKEYLELISDDERKKEFLMKK